MSEFKFRVYHFLAGMPGDLIHFLIEKTEIIIVTLSYESEIFFLL